MNADPELVAMGSVASALQELEPDAAARVLRWASDRFGVAVSSPNVVTSDPAGEPPSDVFDLLSQANVDSNEDRALMIAFWHQVICGEEDFGGADINAVLKQAGHEASNITHVLSRLMRPTPALVQQVSKSGRSKQARKRYRLTRAGIERGEVLRQGSPA